MMNAITFTQAKVRLSELVDRAEARETVEIMRRGKPAARIVPPERKLCKIDVEALEALHARLPYRDKALATSFARCATTPATDGPPPRWEG